MLRAVSLGKKVVSTLAITVAVLFTGVVVLTTGELFFGSSKIKPLFGMTPNGPPGNASLEERTQRRDAGSRALNDTTSAPLNFPLPGTDGGR